MAWPMKNEGKLTHSPTTSTSAVKTTALAPSMGNRRGTASSEALITPVEYSLVSTRTPRTQTASCPNSSPEPRIVLTGIGLAPLQDGEPGEQAGETKGDDDEQDQRPHG